MSERMRLYGRSIKPRPLGRLFGLSYCALDSGSISMTIELNTRVTVSHVSWNHKPIHKSLLLKRIDICWKTFSWIFCVSCSFMMLF